MVKYKKIKKNNNNYPHQWNPPPPLIHKMRTKGIFYTPLLYETTFHAEFRVLPISFQTGFNKEKRKEEIYIQRSILEI